MYIWSQHWRRGKHVTVSLFLYLTIEVPASPHCSLYYSEVK